MGILTVYGLSFVRLKVTLLPFSLPGFTIDRVCSLEQKLLIEARAIRPAIVCPYCQQVSARVHSWYLRSARDLPVNTLHVQLRLSVRRFFCENATCPRRTFAERLPDLVAVHAHRTQRYTEALQVLAFAS